MPKKKQISMFLGFEIYITNINQSFDINFQKSAKYNSYEKNWAKMLNV